jgi:hypothetical protein
MGVTRHTGRGVRVEQCQTTFKLGEGAMRDGIRCGGRGVQIDRIKQKDLVTWSVMT